MRVYPPLRYARGMYGLGQDTSLIDNLPVGTTGTDPISQAALDTSANPGIMTTISNDFNSFLYGNVGGSSSSGTPNSTTAQDIAALGPALAAASKAISAAIGPYQISGTNYLYNPATGQILLNGAAVGTYNPSSGQITAVGSLNIPMMIGLGLGALALVFLLGRK